MRATIALAAPLVEERLLAAFLFDEDMRPALDAAETDDFAELKHKVVWQAMRNLQARGEAIDVLTLEAAVAEHEQLVHAGTKRSRTSIRKARRR